MEEESVAGEGADASHAETGGRGEASTGGFRQRCGGDGVCEGSPAAEAMGARGSCSEEESGFEAGGGSVCESGREREREREREGEREKEKKGTLSLEKSEKSQPSQDSAGCSFPSKVFKMVPQQWL